jgi:hypothetical protein
VVLRASARAHDSAYLACLAFCDSFVVLGDDEHTLADVGTTRPQQGLELFASSLISLGWVRPPRDCGRMHAEIVACGAARVFGESRAASAPHPLREVARVADGVRALVGVANVGGNA